MGLLLLLLLLWLLLLVVVVVVVVVVVIVKPPLLLHPGLAAMLPASPIIPDCACGCSDPLQDGRTCLHRPHCCTLGWLRCCLTHAHTRIHAYTYTHTYTHI